MLNQRQAQTISQLNQQIQHTSSQVSVRFSAMVERSVYEDALEAHNAEAKTTKVTHDHHIAELIEDIGSLKAENARLSNDILWHQDYCQR